ncbi:MAG: tetratricopeptide repeat protein [Candidatus Acidiferrales bacterium]
MAFNKAKTLESASKLLNQGRVSEAIREYQQVLRNDPKDQVTLMTVGDLFARQGDMSQAIEYFERLAQVYLSDGFNSKAIAIYKKIAKLAPNELDPLERLADLYVQQGVLSEARPLFLQIAEAHLKANRAPKAVDVLRRLLEVEPENLRVQMRLAELYNVIGQKKEAAQTYLNYARRLFDRGELADVPKLIDRALEVDPTSKPAIALKAQTLVSGGHPEKAVKLLESLPDAREGGETTGLLMDYLLKAGQTDQAIKLANTVLARGHEHYVLPLRVANTLIEGGQPDEAFPILVEIRDAMIEVGEQDKFRDALSSVVERLPNRIEPLEAFVDFCRHTSDSFRLPDAISRLANAAAAAGRFDQAEKLLSELVERNPDDEKLLDRLNKLRAQRGLPAQTAETRETAPAVQEAPLAAAPVPSPEPEMAEETGHYIAQALTDVDLFSSYGLTQKATHLLENVLQRAPGHVPTLERLLDLYLGAGNERRTAELAAQLEQIHIERGDSLAAERFTELRKRFERAADLKAEELPAPATAPPVMPVAPAAASPMEFSVPVVEPEPPLSMESATPAPVAQASAATPVVENELDLSDEWEALSQETGGEAATFEEPVKETEEVAAAPEEFVISSEAAAAEEAPLPEPAPVAEAQAAPAPETEVAPVFEIEAETPAEPEALAPLELEIAPAYEFQASAETPPAPEPVAAEPAAEEISEPAPGPVQEPAPEPVAAAAEDASVAEFDLELVPSEAAGGTSTEQVMNADDFLRDLVAEVEALDAAVAEPAPAPPAPAPVEVAAKTPTPAPPKEPVIPQIPIPAEPESVLAQAAPSNGSNLNQLEEVFQEFRSELGEMGDEDEDLETHYNLGIAYREMGLLDEAIGEFQKVAKAVQTGKPFRYAMQCSTLLGLTFMDKGDPKIASIWYLRALEIPGIDQETILALRYDLGVAQELAGEASAALDSFRQVYAMNIDYRDVAERIATLQKR